MAQFKHNIWLVVCIYIYTLFRCSVVNKIIRILFMYLCVVYLFNFSVNFHYIQYAMFSCANFRNYLLFDWMWVLCNKFVFCSTKWKFNYIYENLKLFWFKFIICDVNWLFYYNFSFIILYIKSKWVQVNAICKKINKKHK